MPSGWTRTGREGRPRICITGSFGFGDIGDEAMLTEDLDFLLSRMGLPRSDIRLVGHEPDYVSWYHGHPRKLCLSSRWYVADRAGPPPASGTIGALRVQARRLRRALTPESRAARHANLLLVTGGGTINTRDSEGRSLARMHALVMTFKDRGVPVFMVGQTIGPLGLDSRHDRLAAEIIRALDYLSVRDNLYSRQYLEALGCLPPGLVETLDDAAALPFENEPLPGYVNEFLAGGPCAAVNVTEYTADTPEWRQLVAGTCIWLARECGLGLVLVGHTRGDYASLGAIRGLLPDDVAARTLHPDTRNWRAGGLKKLISSCRVALGGRYHFVVFAATADIPFVSMCGNRYSYIKHDGFARQLGLSRLVLTEEQSRDPAALKMALGRALGTKLAVRAGLSRPSRSMRDFEAWLRGRGLLEGKA